MSESTVFKEATAAADPASPALPDGLRSARLTGAALTSAWLAACGGGGGDSSADPNASAAPAAPAPSTPGSPAPAPSPAPTSNLPLPTEKQAARFLSQASLGALPEDVDKLKAKGYSGWLDEQFALATDTSRWDWLVANNYLSTAVNGNLGLDNLLWRKLIASPDTLRQRITIALSEIFVVAATVNSNYRQFAAAAYMDVLEQYAFGNYRALLEAVTLNPAMGLWLNMLGNRKEDPATGRVPDENYAREVMQLLTIGIYRLNPDGTTVTQNGKAVETYDQNDILGLARVFTGWTYGVTRTNTNPEHMRVPMILVASNHSSLEKKFLGVTIAAGTDGVTSLKIALDTLANHPNVGPFIGRQLIQRLVTSNPSAAYVGRVAAVFNNNGAGVRGDLKAVIKAVLLDSEALDDSKLTVVEWGKLREPMLRYVQWARTFKASSPTDQWNIGNTSDPSTRFGQSPFRSPSVFNFFRPGYVPPNTSIGAKQLVAPELQITNESSTIGYINYLQQAVSTGIGEVKSVYSDYLALAADVNALVDRVALLLSGAQLSSTTINQIRAAVNSIAGVSDADRTRRVQATVLLVMTCNEYLVQK